MYLLLPAAKPTGLGEHLTPSSSVISSFVALWLRLGQNLTPSGKVDSLGKIGLPQENLTFLGKFDSLGKI